VVLTGCEGALSCIVGLVGVTVLLPMAFLAWHRGTTTLARERAMLVGLYLLLGGLSVEGCRIRSQEVAVFRDTIARGSTVLDVLRQVDELHTRRPRRWFRIAVWSTMPDPDQVRTINWTGHERFSLGTSGSVVVNDLADWARSIEKVRQLRVVFTDFPTHSAFSVDLDDHGRVTSISRVDGAMN
jgi:hypothetical protein